MDRMHFTKHYWTGNTLLDTAGQDALYKTLLDRMHFKKTLQNMEHLAKQYWTTLLLDTAQEKNILLDIVGQKQQIKLDL